MDQRQRLELARKFGQGVSFDAPMAPYTTLQVGGAAEALFEAHNREDLGRLMGHLKSQGIPYLVVGWGSNLLVKDEGVEGVVIMLRGMFETVEREGEDNPLVGAGAGSGIPDLLRFCRTQGLGGLEFLAGIPGTLGGAVAMNAGAFGHEIGERVQTVQVMTPGGRLMQWERERLRFSYRSLAIDRGNVILYVRLRTDPEDPETVGARIGRYLKHRKERQPLDYPSAGSVFKNPPGDHAGRLLEHAGLKGVRVGGAMISPKHANFIVNTGGATAADILELVRLAQTRVREKSGIQLEPEIHVVGR
jgi:UDP-N-acetylmuramate dehydrogenase